LRGFRSLPLPFDLLFALLVGSTLACGDFVEGAPLRFHPHMGVTGKHGARDVLDVCSSDYSQIVGKQEVIQLSENANADLGVPRPSRIPAFFF
jgi:hypothetical protein